MNRIPVEVLERVFILAVQTPTPPFPTLLDDGRCWSHHFTYLSTLRGLAHTCRRWRHIALQMPALWTCLDSQSRPRLATFTDRSGSAPVSLALTLGRAHARSNKALKLCCSRLRRLDVSLRPKRLPHSLVDLNAPELEVLTIRVRLKRRDWLDDDFARHEPGVYGEPLALKALAIAYSREWLPPNRFDHLTHLYLCGVYLIYGPYNAILQLLSSSPVLESLQLSQIAHPGAFSIFPAPPETRVELPRLRSILVMTSILAPVAWLFTRLELPINVPVLMYDMDYEESVEGRYHSPLLPRSMIEDARHLELICKDDNAIFLRVEGSNSRFRFHSEKSPDIWVKLLEAIPQLPNLRTCHLSLSSGRSIDWQDSLQFLVGRMPRLRVLGLVVPYPIEPATPLTNESAPGAPNTPREPDVLHSLPDSPQNTEETKSR